MCEEKESSVPALLVLNQLLNINRVLVCFSSRSEREREKEKKFLCVLCACVR